MLTLEVRPTQPTIRSKELPNTKTEEERLSIPKPSIGHIDTEEERLEPKCTQAKVEAFSVAERKVEAFLLLL